MFIAHIPAGYLLTRYIQKRWDDRRRSVMITGLIASVFPDFDLFYFYLFDDPVTGHHAYWTHVPAFWAVVAVIVFSAITLSRKTGLYLYAFVALAGIMLHLAMDSVAAEIAWFYPFSTHLLNMVKVPAVYDSWWVWNFVLHWTFALEVMIVAAGGFVWWRDRRQVR